MFLEGLSVVACFVSAGFMVKLWLTIHDIKTKLENKLVNVYSDTKIRIDELEHQFQTVSKLNSAKLTQLYNMNNVGTIERNEQAAQLARIKSMLDAATKLDSPSYCTC